MVEGHFLFGVIDYKEIMNHQEKAAKLFESGYNCAQAVAGAFSDVTGIGLEQSCKLVSGYGGGMGRMREVCGAVSGMVFVLSVLYGYDTPNPEAQKQIYERVQTVAGKFREEAGSIICRELLNQPATDPTPTPRDAAFYAKRPCTRFVMLAAKVLDEHIRGQSEK